MTPRLMVICLGGLAGAGALVCCDLDDQAERFETAPDGEAADSGAEGIALIEPEADPALAH